LQKPFLLIAFFWVSLTGSCRLWNSDSKTLDEFSRSFARFRDAQNDAEILSYILVVNAKEELGGDNYYSLLYEALNSKSKPIDRLTSAELALAIRNNQMQQWLDELEQYVSEQDDQILKLFEHSNSLRDEEFKSTGTAVAELARGINNSYRQLHQALVRRFSAQTQVLREIISNKGAMKLTNKLKEAATEVAESVSDEKRIRTDIERTSANLKDKFHAFKGFAEFQKYPDKYDSQD
jgi:hypothetical protein